MNRSTLIALNAINTLFLLADEDKFAPLKADIEAFNATLLARVGPKADGTPYTREDVQQSAVEARAQLDAIDRLIGPAPQADGDPGN